MKKICIFAAFVLALSLVLCGCTAAQVASGSDLTSQSDSINRELVVWEQAADDAAYMEMMKEKMTEYIDGMTSIAAMTDRLSELESAQKIAADEEFAAVSEQLVGWCQGAGSYPSGSLTEENAKQVCGLTSELAAATNDYITNLPQMLAGEYVGEVNEQEYLNSIIDNAIAIYQMLIAE